MFSESYAEEIKQNFARREQMWRSAWDARQPSRLSAGLGNRLLSEKLREVADAFSRCTPDEAEALMYLYGAMPLPDFLDYPASVYLAYAKHAVFLWREGPFAGRVPERVFTNYVLHYRVNNENITDARGLFYDRLGEIVRPGRSMEETTLDVNYWCAREGTYRSTDIRTQSPLTMLRTAIGRCGEESTFAATALRSVGIPARQVYAPWWSHCDDNHAWVEVWCDGVWHFFGACEPEERLDRGWFVEPASRAMMVHSRWFSLEQPDGETAGTKGAVTLLNQLARYAETARVRVTVRDEEGRPAAGARVRFCVPNGASLGVIATVAADENGAAELLTGRGELFVCAATEDGRCGEVKVRTDSGAPCAIIVRDARAQTADWHDEDFHAPAPGQRREAPLSEQEQRAGAEKLRIAAAHRKEKSEHLTDERALDRALSRFAVERRETAERLLRGARGNEGELIRFLEWDAAGLAPRGWLSDDAWKLRLLETLREKDTWDITAEVLIDCAFAALPFAGAVPDDVFFENVMCPRVAHEFLRPERQFLARCAGAAGADALPRAELCRETLAAFSRKDALGYERVCTSARGVLRGGIANALERKIFCVNLLRALGVPARLRPGDGALEYWADGRFVTPERDETRDASLTLTTDESLRLDEWEHWSVERFDADSGLWLRVWIHGGEGVDTLTKKLAPGVYRAMTTNRLKNGGQLLRCTVFTLEERAEKTLTLSLRPIAQESMTERVPLGEISLDTLEGGKKTLSELAGERRALVVWLAVSREPTEHILNELYDLREEFAKLDAPLYAVLRRTEDLNDPTLSRTMAALPALRILLCPDEAARDDVARLAGQEAGRLPLALVVEKGPACLYSESGYRVGLADLLLKILRG